MIDAKKKEALVAALNKVVKDSVITRPADIDAIPSGSIKLDYVLGAGGYPFGRLTEVFGGESAGKSTLSLELCANAQAMGLIPVYIDVENSLDIEYAASLGVDTSNWVLTQPDNAEDTIRLAEAAVMNGSRMIIVDSLGAMVAHRETEEESDIGDNQIGLLARIIGKFVRRIAPIARKHNAAIILINQRRAKIGAMPGTSTEDTPGGYVLKHGTSIRLKITRTGKESGDEPDFITSKVEAIKNKIAPPYRKDVLKIRFGTGIDIWSEIVDVAVSAKIIKKSGSWYKFGDEVVGQGEDAAGVWLQKNPDVVKQALDTIDHLHVDFYMRKLFGERVTNETE